MNIIISEDIIYEISNIDRLKYLRKYYGNLYDMIDKNVKNIFVSYRYGDYVTSINPDNAFNTPTGLYTYPLYDKHHKKFLDFFLNSFIGNEVNTEKIFDDEYKLFPYIPSSEKLIVYQLYNNSGIVTTDVDGLEIFKKNKNKLQDFFYKSYASHVDFPITEDEIKYFIEKNIGFSNVEYRNKFSILYLFLHTISRSNMTRLRRYLVEIGINGIIDYGKGVIHRNELTQAVFFTPKKNLKLIGQIGNHSFSAEVDDNEVDLSGKGYTYIPIEKKKKYRNHRGYLDLSHNNIKKINSIRIFKAKKINLSYNVIIDLGYVSLKDEVKEIDLSNNKIKDINEFKKFIFINKHLNVINLTNNPITQDEGFYHALMLAKSNDIEIIYK